MQIHQTLDLRHIKGRVIIVGDIHGLYDHLMERLAEIRFDFENEHLISVGDIVDRGPQNHEVMGLISKPWFHRILGNHETMVAMASRIGAPKGIVDWHCEHGGTWFSRVEDNTERMRIADLLMDAPYAMTVLTPGGRRIGIVHADVLGNDWDEFVKGLEADVESRDTGYRYHSIWERDRILTIKRDIMLARETTPAIQGVHHVYMGHTPVINPITVANMSWIDTGRYGRLTFANPDA